VEEALAQTRLRVLTRVAGYTMGTRYLAWLRRLARTNALDVAKTNRRCPLPGSTDERWSWLVDQSVVMPEELETDLHDRGSELRTLIAHLIPRLRDVVLMRAVGGSLDDMAAVLGIPMSTIKSRLHGARTALVELERDRGSAGEV